MIFFTITISKGPDYNLLCYSEGLRVILAGNSKLLKRKGGFHHHRCFGGYSDTCDGWYSRSCTDLDNTVSSQWISKKVITFCRCGTK